MLLNVPVYYTHGQDSLVAAPKTRVIALAAFPWYVPAVAATFPQQGEGGGSSRPLGPEILLPCMKGGRLLHEVP